MRLAASRMSSHMATSLSYTEYHQRRSCGLIGENRRLVRNNVRRLHCSERLLCPRVRHLVGVQPQRQGEVPLAHRLARRPLLEPQAGEGAVAAPQHGRHQRVQRRVRNRLRPVHPRPARKMHCRAAGRRRSALPLAERCRTKHLLLAHRRHPLLLLPPGLQLPLVLGGLFPCCNLCSRLFLRRQPRPIPEPLLTACHRLRRLLAKVATVR
mmetsp:Transcript_25035/g.84356  ORF Transcript_25035/g.84356 Transcript_25035/m.84356 type:complete len:210 (-) Transcript_25035:26-655(-)